MGRLPLVWRGWLRDVAYDVAVLAVICTVVWFVSR